MHRSASEALNNGPQHCRDLGERLRNWYSETGAGTLVPVGWQRLQAVLFDHHHPGHGDRILYEYLLRRQGFQALMATAEAESTARAQLAVLALLEEARLIFNRESLDRMQAFLEGFAGLAHDTGAKTVLAEWEAVPGPSMHGPGQSGASAQGVSLAGGPPLEQQAPTHASRTGEVSADNRADHNLPARHPLIPAQVASDPMVAAALELAIIQGTITTQQQVWVRGGRRGLLHFHLTDADGCTLARVHLAMLAARIRRPEPPSQPFNRRHHSSATSEQSASGQDPLFACALDLAIRQGLLTPQRGGQVSGGHRGLLHYHLTDSTGRTLARVHLGLMHAGMKPLADCQGSDHDREGGG